MVNGELKYQKWRQAVIGKNKRRFMMIVVRNTFNVKLGCMDKVIQLNKSEVATWDNPPIWRFYTPNDGKNDKFAEEFEFENLAESEKFWTAWLAKPETSEFIKKWNELVETGERNEVWDMVE
jgi:hypothetical protein